MRKLAIAAAFASTILATPAVARDGAMYVGIEGGAMIVQDLDLDYASPSISVEDGITIDHRVGFDVDVIGGYDLGMVRVELEGAYKRASIDQLRFQSQILPDAATGIDADGRVGVTSLMINALLDLGADDGWRGYVGGGVGRARVKYRAFTEEGNLGGSDRDYAMAWQAIAGVSAAMTPNIDLGLKYRYFNTGRLEGSDSAVVPFTVNGKFRSHSLLASLVYNLWTPAPPPPVVVAPPPPPPPPATQTCPDGSVILATDVCPAPPPPPPPPPPTEERG